MKTQHLHRYLFLPLLLAVVVLSAFSLKDYRDYYNERVKGNGNIRQETRTAQPFRHISSSGSFKVYITPGSNHGIQVEADENLLPYIITEVEGNELELRIKRGYDVRPTKPINIYLTMSELEGISSSGSGGFYSKGVLKGDKVKMSFSGSADADLDLQANALKVGVSGSGNLKLKGNVASTNYGISGSGDIDAFDLQSGDVHVGVSGSGNVNVFAEKKLDISISGVGNIRYKGNPNINQSVSGMGKVHKED